MNATSAFMAVGVLHPGRQLVDATPGRLQTGGRHDPAHERRGAPVEPVALIAYLNTILAGLIFGSIVSLSIRGSAAVRSAGSVSPRPSRTSYQQRLVLLGVRRVLAACRGRYFGRQLTRLCSWPVRPPASAWPRPERSTPGRHGRVRVSAFLPDRRIPGDRLRQAVPNTSALRASRQESASLP